MKPPQPEPSPQPVAPPVKPVKPPQDEHPPQPPKPPVKPPKPVKPPQDEHPPQPPKPPVKPPKPVKPPQSPVNPPQPVQPPGIQAVTGTACMVNAPSGAPIFEGAQAVFGHVGWAFRVPGTDQWYYGATEAIQGSPDPDRNGQTWVDEGSWGDVVNAFKGVGGHTKRNYYTQLRCQEIENPDLGDAMGKVAKFKAPGSGFDAFTNNCLTRSVEILDAYGAELPIPFLLGLSLGPNKYFNEKLGQADWPSAQSL
ncbi:hypothetical protein [Streptomyces sp. NPDC054797]